MNRTENFIALAAVSIVGDVTDPQGWKRMVYVGMAAFFFVRWLNLARDDATHLDR